MSQTSSSTARPLHPSPVFDQQPQPSDSKSRIPVTPALLRSIFASSRTPLEERSISRLAFFRFAGFLLSCLGISLVAARGRAIKSGAALLGVV
ncbi:hypothetical protein DFJ43DRAFT_1006756 [Lentinula guzmanii]|uniref:Uncharacterized protein n=4 Tax=Lentinula TaxID=5352 RepID=A0AA38J375_9AGAR|nr:hypothetical protein DFJ43DRAFT_1006756 [Lentinula guzmanii]KAJ3739540.1 hypothetical protein DFH05DRAFT_1453691 [Lentinula detonsa]KAJ3789430.1 hypothetical protein GGU10DRAFT_284163 [Lentinula aff. detonsa]KAJ4001802.1 hypothetical protein F5050DRAFT_1137572 [Lentinula boryana]KAJ3802054.1 hypothetical protein GGU11DRAFT_107746 [Lentinula aff. detonsa]